MDPHRIAEARSLAYHRVVAERLAADETIVPHARRRVERWITEDRSPSFALRWRALLDGPRERLLEALVDPGQEATALRQCSPFAGVLEPRLRWALWRRVREEVEAQHEDPR